MYPSSAVSQNKNTNPSTADASVESSDIDVNIAQVTNVAAFPDVLTRQKAAERLGRFWNQPDKSIRALSYALETDPADEVRSSAALSLGQMVNSAPRVVPLLARVLLEEKEDKNVRVRHSAAVALGHLSSSAAAIIPVFRRALREEPTLFVRQAVIFWTARLGPLSKDLIQDLVVAYQKTLRSSIPLKREKIAYVTSHPISENNEKLQLEYIDKHFDQPLQPLIDEQKEIAETLVFISSELANHKDTSAIESLETAYAELRENPDLQKSSDSIYSNIIDLRNTSGWHFSKRLLQIPFLVMAGFTGLLVLCAALYVFQPLWLLRINEFLSRAPEIKLDKLGGLTVSLRYLLVVGFFHYSNRVLDAWVSSQMARVRHNFDRKQTVSERALHVPLSVLLDNLLIDNLTADSFLAIFAERQNRIVICGEGGAGKTSLACQLAKWAMNHNPNDRVCPSHKMIPILIEHDFERSAAVEDDQFLTVISEHVQDITKSPDVMSPSLVRQLLKQRRLLVIVDSMSEMNDSSRQSVSIGISRLPVNSIIITSRFREQLRGLDATYVEPRRMKSSELESFITTYLRRLSKAELFRPIEFETHCKRLDEMIGNGRDITVLLAKYYVVNMIAAKEGFGEGPLPSSVPDLMVKYVRLIGRKPGPRSLDTNTIVQAAEVIAWECLRVEYRPTPAKLDDVFKALSDKLSELPILNNLRLEKKRSEMISFITRYLEKNLKLIEFYGVHQNRIRFAIDTLSEYLAGLFLIREFGCDELKWVTFFQSLDEKSTKDFAISTREFGLAVNRHDTPDVILSFLIALYDCCQTDEAQGQIPGFVLSELEHKIHVTRICRGISSESPSTRLEALNAIRDLDLRQVSYGRTFILPRLIELLTDGEIHIKETASAVLYDLSDFAVPGLEIASQREESELAITAVRLLSKIKYGAGSSA